ncbi:hypothetical protein XELAEV_18043819mg [Xenopus laevis]|uniref:Uncharacterized protein n=1 Tax=Xenopus laevis TaxID=8355 RepID=A0A974BXC9_XENLA|nr:hypothetical protein XELAEV_18043819mg [Xenopus laevis]
MALTCKKTKTSSLRKLALNKVYCVSIVCSHCMLLHRHILLHSPVVVLSTEQELKGSIHWLHVPIAQR